MIPWQFAVYSRKLPRPTLWDGFPALGLGRAQHHNTTQTSWDAGNHQTILSLLNSAILHHLDTLNPGTLPTMVNLEIRILHSDTSNTLRGSLRSRLPLLHCALSCLPQVNFCTSYLLKGSQFSPCRRAVLVLLDLRLASWVFRIM